MMVLELGPLIVLVFACIYKCHMYLVTLFTHSGLTIVDSLRGKRAAGTVKS